MKMVTDRLKHLTTQLHWRLNEGKGIAFYEVGVRDNGEPVGITEEVMVQSVRTLARCVCVCIVGIEGGDRKRQTRLTWSDWCVSADQNGPSAERRAPDCSLSGRPQRIAQKRADTSDACAREPLEEARTRCVYCRPLAGAWTWSWVSALRASTIRLSLSPVTRRFDYLSVCDWQCRERQVDAHWRTHTRVLGRRARTRTDARVLVRSFMVLSLLASLSYASC